MDIDHNEPGWHKYSAAVNLKTKLWKYIQDASIFSALVNALINGIIAFFSYRTRSGVPYAETSADVPITVFILTFLITWITVGSVRNEFIKGNLENDPSVHWRMKLPKGSASRALLFAVIGAILWGGLIDAVLFLIQPNEFNNWVYMLVKIIYIALTAALATAVSILSVASDENRRG